MRRTLLILLAVAAFPATASAAPVLVLGHDGHVRTRNDPFVRGPVLTPTPAFAAAAPPHRRRRPERTVFSELARLRRAGAISAAVSSADAGSYRAALAEESRLRGTRRAELVAVTETLHDIAAARQLTPSRLSALFATLAVNRQWWAQAPIPAAGQRVEIAGSELVWEYYPGQGIQLQVLGSFGRADGLFTTGPTDYPELQQLLAQLIPLAARRAGGLTWEYYFRFDGGAPPWTSAMSQATGLEALSRAYQATHNPYYLQVAAAAMPVLSAAPPVGVNVPTTRGTRFTQYSFSPRTSILNAFLQTLIGLYDYGQVSGNPIAQRLFASGDAEAMAEVPSFDTGAWSLYQPGIEDTLDYHELVIGFLAQLCARTGAPVYCATAQRFTADLTTPPGLTQLVSRARAGHPFTLRFALSKISHVGIVVARGGTTVFATSASFPRGVDDVAVPALRPAGNYTVTLAGTDLAGNFARVAGTLAIVR